MLTRLVVFSPFFSAQTRYHAEQPRPLPPLGAAVAARASESTSVGPSRHQLPPLHLSPSRVSESVASSPSERKHGGEGKDGNDGSPTSGPPKRGDGSGGGGAGRSPSSAPAEARQPQLHPSQPQHNGGSANVVAPPEVGQRGATVVRQMQQGLSDGTMSMLQVLSQSAARAAETERARRASSAGSTGSTGSINSTGTQSSFEYD